MSLPVPGNTTLYTSRTPTGSAPTPGSTCNTAGVIALGVAFTLDITHNTTQWFTWPTTNGTTYRVTYTKNSGSVPTVAVDAGSACGSAPNQFTFISSPGDNSFVAGAGNGYIEVTADISNDGNYTIKADTDPPTMVTASLEAFVTPAYGLGVAHNEETGAGKPYTHIALVNATADVRDGYQGNGSYAGVADTIKIPDANGTSYLVRFVELMQPGTAAAHKRVYLDRLTPNWPDLY